MKLENNPLQNKSYDFALIIVKLSRKLMNYQKEFTKSPAAPWRRWRWPPPER